MAKGSDLKNMTEEDLQSQVREMEASLFNLKFQSSLGKLENTSQIRVTRRDLARAKTILNEKRSTASAKRPEAVQA